MLLCFCFPSWCARPLGAHLGSFVFVFLKELIYFCSFGVPGGVSEVCRRCARGVPAVCPRCALCFINVLCFVCVFLFFDKFCFWKVSNFDEISATCQFAKSANIYQFFGNLASKRTGSRRRSPPAAAAAGPRSQTAARPGRGRAGTLARPAAGRWPESQIGRPNCFSFSRPFFD